MLTRYRPAAPITGSRSDVTVLAARKRSTEGPPAPRENALSRPALAAVARASSHGVCSYVEPTQQTVDALMKLDLSAGVDVEIKL